MAAVDEDNEGLPAPRRRRLTGPSPPGGISSRPTTCPASRVVILRRTFHGGGCTSSSSAPSASSASPIPAPMIDVVDNDAPPSRPPGCPLPLFRLVALYPEQSHRLVLGEAGGGGGTTGADAADGVTARRVRMDNARASPSPYCQGPLLGNHHNKQARKYTAA